MRTAIIAGLAGLVATAAAAQAPTWQYYEPTPVGDFKPIQAIALSADGMQLILKCDEPGEQEVYAVVVTKLPLAAGQRGRFETRPVTVRFDGGSTSKETWRFNQNFAMAMDDRTVRNASRFISGLAKASKVDIVLEPTGSKSVSVSFPVAGAKDAIDRVYTSCRDKNPVA